MTYVMVFLLGMTTAAFCLNKLGAYLIKKQGSDLESAIGRALDLMTEHLGSARVVYGIKEKGPKGPWTICVRCPKCNKSNRLGKGVKNSGCAACHHKFSDPIEGPKKPPEVMN